MSIVTMQRKSARFQAPHWISGQGENGFSLVGGHRNVGAVGPTNLGRSVTRTPFRGTEAMGGGGCCGTYDRIISNSGSCCTNKNNIIKTTTKNTAGMIQMKYSRKWDENLQKWVCPRVVLNSQYPNYWVQSSTALGGETTQGEYVTAIHRRSGSCDPVVPADGQPPNAGDNNCKNCIFRSGGKLYFRTPYAKTLLPLKGGYAEFQSGQLMKNNCLFQYSSPTTDKNGPFPMSLTHNGCDKNFNTVQDAIAAGMLPADHVDA